MSGIGFTTPPDGQAWVGMTDVQIEIERARSIPGDATVRHYEELSEPAKMLLSALIARDSDSTATTDAEVAETFEEFAGDIVKFTDYYRIRQRPARSPS